ncbi:glycoside hydrolase family 32 protein [Parablautia muri]|uniref:Sucrose-6-phosphate hydrolase n=1 Tax=Parablautia muri TaxID=2320879 RepID=A0A9X5BEB7_9FIRM|nr:glycoside hydrolase family 32 protein [Parablautia muri]NBJ92256.1 glycoside hydrolase family 32 protein [Parablautia muri]
MTSQTLREARTYEEASEKFIKKEDRPDFHLSTRTGWLNDPNGFSYYKGEYHMFYQYHPYDSHWGPMHWGHAVSKDLLHWRYLPAALAPDEFYDRDGCFSGSAVELPDGRQLLMYTGVVKERQKNGGFSEVQTQCLAVGDGLDYEKYENNPVLDEKDLPPGSSRFDFRDPKMWKKEDGTYCCVIGSRPADGSGQILLYTSEDGFHWSFQKILASNNNRFGKMWECPDFFMLDGKAVLLTSPQDMLPQGFEYHNGNGTLCLIGDFDEETDTFTEQHNQSIDYGIDFYAPQTILTPDGRRVMIGWMQNWDTCGGHVQENLWFGQMSLPREIFIKNGRLYQKPIRELYDMRSGKVEYQSVLVSDTVNLEGMKGRKADIELSIWPEDEKNVYHKFSVRFAQNAQYQTSVSFRPKESVLKIDRKFSGSRRAVIHQRRSKVNHENGRLKLRLILDQYSVEIFVNDGEQVMTATMYTEREADGISFCADGEVRMDVVKYDLV